ARRAVGNRDQEREGANRDPGRSPVALAEGRRGISGRGDDEDQRERAVWSGRFSGCAASAPADGAADGADVGGGACAVSRGASVGPAVLGGSAPGDKCRSGGVRL